MARNPALDPSGSTDNKAGFQHSHVIPELQPLNEDMLSALITLTTLFVLSNAQSWVPSGDLPVDFTLTFSAPESVYNVCNRSFTQSARTISVATTGVSVTPGETAHHPTAMISGDLFTILMVDPDTSSADVGTTEKPLLHMLITDITSAEPGTASVLERYRGPMPPPCSGDHTYHCLLLKQTAALTLTVDDLSGYASHCTNYGLAGWCLFEVADFISSNQLTPVGYVTMVAATDGYVRYQYVNGRGIGESESCRGLEGYDPCSTSTEPPTSSSENVTTAPPSSSSEKDTTEPPSSSSEKDTTEPPSSSSEKDTTAPRSSSSEKDTTEPPSSSSEKDTTEPSTSSSEKDTTEPPSSSSEEDTTAPPSSSSEEDTTAPPSSSSEKVMMSLCAVMASALCLIFSFISVLN
ncbi:hypothetical protein Bbelb_413480 [Branchiostoma belcheri]|nr:hypothetical protein Bbelb_413480 [Branchiostoma belcheri]